MRKKEINPKGAYFVLWEQRGLRRRKQGSRSVYPEIVINNALL